MLISGNTVDRRAVADVACVELALIIAERPASTTQILANLAKENGQITPHLIRFTLKKAFGVIDKRVSFKSKKLELTRVQGQIPVWASDFKPRGHETH